MLRTLLIVLLILLILGALPLWPYAAGWGVGYAPSGLFIILLVVVIVLAARGRL